ncbi:unnamed protein product [Caenorhabditis nigoni]
MPIRLLSLPGSDIQYALNCMDIGELIAFSLCSKRTKDLVKSSNRKIEEFSARVFENQIRFHIIAKKIQDVQNVNQDEYSIVFFKIFDSCIEFDREKGAELWRKKEFTQNDWIPHFLSIFHEKMIHSWIIGNVSLFCLDKVKQLISQCKKLVILYSPQLTRTPLHKLLHFAEEVEIRENRFDDVNDISKILTLNLKSVRLVDYENAFKLTLEDLSVINITDVRIDITNITEKELNRYLKLWMKGNHTFYPPKNMKLSLRNVINREEVLRGIQYQIVDNKNRLKREDGKELLISIRRDSVDLEFQ